MKNAEKKDILTRAVSTGVLTNSVFFSFLCFVKFCIFAGKHYKIGGSTPKRETQKTKTKLVKNWSKLAFKTGPSMLLNKSGPVFNARNGSYLFASFSFENPLFSAGRMTENKWTSF